MPLPKHHVFLVPEEWAAGDVGDPLPQLTMQFIQLMEESGYSFSTFGHHDTTSSGGIEYALIEMWFAYGMPSKGPVEDEL